MDSKEPARRLTQAKQWRLSRSLLTTGSISAKDDRYLLSPAQVLEHSLDDGADFTTRDYLANNAVSSILLDKVRRAHWTQVPFMARINHLTVWRKVCWFGKPSACQKHPNHLHLSETPVVVEIVTPCDNL